MNCKTHGLAIYSHAPGADLDYGLDWRENKWLETDETITNSVWTVQPAGVILTRDQISQGAVTSVFAKGGINGRQYVLTNTITTSSGRVDSRTIRLNCKTR